VVERWHLEPHLGEAHGLDDGGLVVAHEGLERRLIVGRDEQLIGHHLDLRATLSDKGRDGPLGRARLARHHARINQHRRRGQGLSRISGPAIWLGDRPLRATAEAHQRDQPQPASPCLHVCTSK
jgi:hypothetical protein